MVGVAIVPSMSKWETVDRTMYTTWENMGVLLATVAVTNHERQNEMAKSLIIIGNHMIASAIWNK